MPTSYDVVIGDPAQSIMEFDKKERMDLIVMSTHGKSGLKRAIMGRVADAVIRDSGKPVLVIRPHPRNK
ncbi:MAG TPA: universal stress protein [Dehalococcoidia bacterium]|jgi:nucleotide-binding universal stress UspA family protein|nr:universal stress protein [Dehalococcoidia bacterium]